MENESWKTYQTTTKIRNLSSDLNFCIFMSFVVYPAETHGQDMYGIDTDEYSKKETRLPS